MANPDMPQPGAELPLQFAEAAEPGVRNLGAGLIEASGTADIVQQPRPIEALQRFVTSSELDVVGDNAPALKALSNGAACSRVVRLPEFNFSPQDLYSRILPAEAIPPGLVTNNDPLMPVLIRDDHTFQVGKNCYGLTRENRVLRNGALSGSMQIFVANLLLLNRNIGKPLAVLREECGGDQLGYAPISAVTTMTTALRRLVTFPFVYDENPSQNPSKRKAGILPRAFFIDAR